jgi:hypothetical protein
MSDLKTLLTRSHDLIMRELNNGHTAGREEQKFWEYYQAAMKAPDADLKTLAAYYSEEIKMKENNTKNIVHTHQSYE